MEDSKNDYEKVWLNCFGDKKDKIDPFGKKIRFELYGQNKPMGWVIDHIWPVKPKDKSEGSNDFANKQPLHYLSSQKKGNKLKGKVFGWEFIVKRRYRINKKIVGYMLVEESEENGDLVEWYDYEAWQ